MPRYQPPYVITPRIVTLVAEIGAAVAQWSLSSESAPAPVLRRDRRIRSVQASLAIENNSLTIEQVTAVLAGKRVLAPPREIQEVQNAFAAYEQLPNWQPTQRSHLLAAHRLLMSGLMERAGLWRNSGVGVYRNRKLVHMAPPASRVGGLMQDLVSWLKRTDAHPLISSCVFHSEFEFIHPFADGNGRLGRLWQTLILSQWNPLFAWLPVETVIKQQQSGYYAALAAADRASEATPFVEFMLGALQQALAEALRSETSDAKENHRTARRSTRASREVVLPPDAAHADNILRLLAVLKPGETQPALVLMQRLGLKHRPSFRTRYLQPAVASGLLQMTVPDSPNSPKQRYRLRE